MSHPITSLLGWLSRCGLLAVLGGVPATAAVSLVQLSSTVYQTEHCLYIIDSSVNWSSASAAYSDIYTPSGGTFPRLSGYFDTLTANFPAAYFSICYIANTGASNVPNYIDQIFKANGIQEPGTAGAPQSFSTVDFCRYNLGGGSVFTPMIAVFDHELGHAWGAQIFHTLSPPMLSNGHWLSNSTIDCQLSATYSDDGYATVNKIYGDPTNGFRWQRVSNLRSNDGEVFSEQELYAMGASANFPTAYVLNTPVYNSDHTMSYSSVDTFDHAAVLAQYGARSPGYQTSPKQFRLGFVYVARDAAEVNAVFQAVEQSIDHFCNAEAIDTAGYRFQTPFLADTRYRASVVGRLSNLDGNAAPVLTVTNTYVASTDGSATIGFSATDDSGVTPSVTVVPTSNHCAISGSNVQISGLPDGVHFFTLKAVDTAGKKSFGHFVVEVQRPAAAITISAQPANRAISANSSTTFSVSANGTPASLSYRWLRQAANTSTWNDLSEGGSYTGTTTATLSVIASTAMNGDRFDCVVSNSSGAVTSSVATLVVDEVAPPITTQPGDQTLAAGNAAHFNIATTGAPATYGYNTYQWQRKLSGSVVWMDLTDGSGITGATTSALTVGSVTIAMNGDQYRCVASNTTGSTTSNAANLAVGTTPAITAHPQPVSAAAGQDVTFSVIASGSAPLSYQWYKYSTPIVGVNSATLTLTGVQASDAGAYYVKVSNSVGTATSNSASLQVSAAAPSITVQPQSASSTLGQSVSFSVTAARSAPLSYQWRKNNVAISGATSATLSLANVQSSDGADYTVVVSNSAGSVTSSTATLTLVSSAVPASIANQPQSLVVIDGQTASFSVVAGGTAPFTYQWQKDAVPIAGATSATLALGVVHAGDAGSYTVVVTNSAGSVTSAAATLSVTAAVNAPSISSQPLGATITAGQSVSFSVGATGSGTITYQWQRNGAAIGGGTSATLSIAAAQTADAGNYSVIVSNAAGSVTSSSATLNVLIASTTPSITLQPVSVTVAAGATATLFVSATGTPAPSYQWFFNNSPIAGATSGSLTLTNVQASNAGAYSVAVSNSAGSVQSATATVALFAADFSGFYQGSFGASGDFALLAGRNGVNVLLARFASSGEGFLATGFAIGTDGSLSVSSIAGLTTSGDPRFYSGTLSGQLSASGITIDIPALHLSGSGAKISGSGNTVAIAGYYESVPIGQSSAEAVFAVGENGQVAVLELTMPARLAVGIIDGNGMINLTAGTGVSASQYTGTFLSGGFTGIVNTDGSSVSIQPPPGVVGHQRLINISSRGVAGSSDRTLIAGFVLSGTEAKDVLIRAVGPSLSGLGVSGALADPKLRLFSGGNAILENDNWSTAGSSIAPISNQVGAFSLPVGSRDAALLAHLSPGAYTAQVLTPSGTSGVTMIEVYDASPIADTAPKVVNISTRADVGRGDDILIAGFVVTGDAPKKILLRGIGPGLTALGVNGALADPIVKLFQGSRILKQNDNWSENSDAALIAATAQHVGAFALAPGSKDSALLIYLLPGPYTVQVSGVGNTTGIGMVEVYEVTD